jgi:hypothetical protein
MESYVSVTDDIETRIRRKISLKEERLKSIVLLYFNTVPPSLVSYWVSHGSQFPIQSTTR